jgi:hypothetical protein
MMPPKKPEAPDFDLGPLLKLPNDFLKATDPAKRSANALILSLGSVFNDLKGVLWLIDQQIKWRQPGNSATAYNGQMTGINVQLQRFAVGILHELIELMRRSEPELNHPDVVAAVSKLTKGRKKSWGVLMATVKNSKTGAAVASPSMANFLRMVRNSTTFHYDKSYLMEGYEKWVIDATKEPNDANQNAFVSLGKNAEETRFYFSDVPVTTRFLAELTNRGFTVKDLKEFVMDVNQALRFVIAYYIYPEGIPK